MPGQPSTELNTAQALIVLDPNTLPSNLIVDRELEFSVAMEFTVSGLSSFLLGYLQFEVVYTYESIGRAGGAAEGTLGTKVGNTRVGKATYNHQGPLNEQTTYRVAANRLDPGVYRLSAVVTFKLGPIRQPIHWPLTGFTESPAIQVTP